MDKTVCEEEKFEMWLIGLISSLYDMEDQAKQFITWKAVYYLQEEVWKNRKYSKVFQSDLKFLSTLLELRSDLANYYQTFGEEHSKNLTTENLKALAVAVAQWNLDQLIQWIEDFPRGLH